MKRIFTALLVGGVLFLASCGNGSNPALPVLPVADSSTFGSNLWIAFSNDTFAMFDYALNGVPVVTIHATNTYDSTDSFWYCNVLVTDTKTQKIAMNVTARNKLDTGSFIVTNNFSSLTDYSEGANKTYSIAIGSVVYISQPIYEPSYPIKGKMTLGLYYNHATINAVDSFTIYH